MFTFNVLAFGGGVLNHLQDDDRMLHPKIFFFFNFQMKHYNITL